ncbi:glycosyl transferase [Bacteroidia bacterium]|nr:glycosyl transferase [Bacteroidia bacterium]
MMKEINLYLLDISNEGNTSGVDRCLNTYLTGLKNYPFIRVVRIQLLRGKSVFLWKEEQRENYTSVVIPIPQQSDAIIGERYWFQKYNEYVFSLTKHLFENKSNCIIHIHTLNLIALASYIKTQVPCKIITHLHCIPWKDTYNNNRKKFNLLYSLSGEKGKLLDEKQFFTNNCEWESYTAPDKVICVTHSGKEFLKQIMHQSAAKISVVSNGINDLFNDGCNRKQKVSSVVFQCLFVGFLLEAKGVFYILEALRKVQAKGYTVMLNMAGNVNPQTRQRIEEKYNDLQINLLGRIPFEELQKLYQESDIGIIASLQEQCSYAAIEMAMFGLPIVTTAVDGLDEMFTDGVNALKVNTKFSKVFGLSVDTDMLSDKIITLIENDDLRRQLGANVRQLYKERFGLDKMMQQTIEVYKELVYE